MKLPVKIPFSPRELDVTAEFILGDVSKRIPSGVRLVVLWVNQNGDEWGFERFISEEELVGEKS